MKFKSIKFKISVLYTIFLGFLLAIYSLFLYQTLSQALKKELDVELREKVRLINIFINEFHEEISKSDDGTATLIAAIDMTVNMSQLKKRTYVYINADKEWLKLFDYLDLSEDFILFLDTNGELILSTQNVDAGTRRALSAVVEKDEIEEEYFKHVTLSSDVVRVIQTPFYFRGELKFIILIATSEKPMINILDERKGLLLWSIPVVLVLVILIGVVFANRLVAPIIEIADVAEQISYKDLTQRVTSQYNDDEIYTLINAFNGMIDRLQRSFSHIVNFNSHVAHELKTPIAIIKGECEVALRNKQKPEEYRDALKAILEETQRMLKIVEDLLLLARLSYSTSVFSFVEFDLKEFFREMCLKQQLLALPAGVALTFSLPKETIKVKGDPVHLGRLFVNIISNAIKFTPRDGNVDVGVTVKGRDLMVRISDTGIGIAQDDIEKIFNQFYHKSPVELADAQGTGLGLSIAKSIAESHGGRITVESAVKRGSVFTVVLPVVVPSA